MNEPAEDYLEKALSAAFAAVDGGRPEHATETVRAAGPAKVPERVGRYPVEALVGRGGIGLVLRARDSEIGRSIAVKLLHEHLGADPEMVSRFVEEARVGGGLEHPGVVPVHEMGRTEDGRPYFTMKLVEGTTFAEKLAARRGPGDDRALFLSRFERICQVVAYAHARGVVHLDLKPANVLIGGFGEVLVTDWGFAKAMANPKIEAPKGRIFGTPAYMSPEQARGDAAKVGTRSDVFALGAILCEILTGAPPYEADSANEVLLAASRSWLDEAWKRLDSCGADARLVALARRCLSPDPASRPAEAGAVAIEVESYLRSLEDQARKLAIEAAEARANATAERRQRRLTMTLFAVVFAASAALGIGYLWFERSAAARRAEDERLVAGMGERARVLAERARAAPEPAPALWDAPVATASEAAGIAKERGLPSQVARELEGLYTTLLSEQAAASTNVRLLRDLETIHEHVGDARDAARRDRDYAEAFRRGGIDVVALDVETAAARVRSSPLRDAIVIALDDWAFSRRSSVPPADPAPLVAVVNRVDPDAWRVRVRTAAAAGDVKALEALAASAAEDADSAESQLLLAQSLRRAGRRGAAILVFDRAELRFPGDYEIHHQLGILRRDGPREHWGEAVRQFSMALALRPESAHAMVDLGQALLQSGSLEAAERHLEAALRLTPDYAPALHYLGAVQYRRGNLEAAESRLVASLAIDPDFAAGSLLLGLTRRDAGRYTEAEVAFRDAVRADPRFAEGWADLANVLLNQGRFQDAQVAFKRCHEASVGRGARWKDTTAAWLADIEKLIAAERELRDLGSDLPVDADPDLALLIARAAWFSGRPLTSSRIFEWLFEPAPGAPAEARVDPAFLMMGARAAIAAGSGGGTEAVPEGDRPKWRKLGLLWLTRALDGAERSWQKSPDAETADDLLNTLRRDPAYRFVRDPEPLGRLPGPEAESWKALWTRVDRVTNAIRAP